jgi:F-type H+-transporting ATPase subunit epsilon
MAGNIKLEVVTPEGAVVSEEAQIVVASGTLGEFGVLSGHTPFLTTLKSAGTVRYTDTSGKDHYIFVSGGFAEALPNKVTILAESAERRRDIDEERAKRALKRAEERLAQKNLDEIEYARARAELERALHRIKLLDARRS